MAKQEKTISIREYAKRLNVDESAVRAAIESGKIKKGVKMITRTVKGKKVEVPSIIPSAANKEYGQLKSVVKPQRGLSRKKVSEKLDGLPVPKPGKKGNKSEAAPRDESDPELPELQNMTYEELLQKLVINDTMQYAEVMRVNEIQAAALNRMKLEKELGKLVEKAVVDQKLFEVGSQLKKNMQNIPARIVPLIRSSPNDVDGINLLLTEINTVLEQLASSV